MVDDGAASPLGEVRGDIGLTVLRRNNRQLREAERCRIGRHRGTASGSLCKEPLGLGLVSDQERCRTAQKTAVRAPRAVLGQ